jgi:hypothetical protein
MPDPSLAGSLGKKIGDSRPGWSILGDVEPAKGSPSILLILVGDQGGRVSAKTAT